MLVPVADIILLAMLVLFFGLEQRRRTELYFRFWLAGWVLVLLSVLFWDFPLQRLVGRPMQDLLWQDASACGGIAFLFSFMVSERRWQVPFQCALAVAVPVCLSMDLIVLGRASQSTLLTLIATGEGLSIWMGKRYLRRGGGWLFPTVTAVCVGCGGCMAFVMAQGRFDDLEKLIMFQMFVLAGLLFARSRFAGGRFIGALGFFAWASFQLFDTSLFNFHWLTLATKSVWTIPKYLVGMGMILKIFEGAKREIVDLGERQRRLYEEYRVLFMGNPHPMWIYDVQTMRFLAVNHAALGAYGYSAEAFLAMSVMDIEVGERPGLAMDFGRRVAKRSGRHQRADGTAFDVDVTDHDMVFEERAARFVLAMDITEREDLHRELVRQAQHDVLTGLPNRSMLDDRIEQCLSRCMREDRKGAVLTVDIDHFKRVNDTYGHLVGDECLKAVAARLSSRVRQVDTIARTGGEEFTIVVGGLGNRVAAETVCAGMLQLFDTPMLCGENELRVTVSIGVALFPDHAIEIEGLRRRSDQALYEAKRLGRNRAVFASTVNV